MNIHWYLCVFCALITYADVQSQQILSLIGDWTVSLEDSRDIKHSSLQWGKRHGHIELPSSLAEQGFGMETAGSKFGNLTATHEFIGIARYQKEIHIPEMWEYKHISLFLERVLWQSRVLIDGVELSTQDALGTPHIHPLGHLSAGKHTLEVLVNNDMIYNIGDKGHAYGEYTQTIWNGIVGRIELQAKDPVHLTTLQTFPLYDQDALRIDVGIFSDRRIDGTVVFHIVDLHGKQILSRKVECDLTPGPNQLEVLIELEGRLDEWTEFDPNVYVLEASLDAENFQDLTNTEFGFLKVSHDGTKILINNQPIFLRGNLDCVHFPITGYPSTKIEDWLRIFNTYKDFGFNHVRFHSWCPPEAAFKAANRVGIYIQTEGSIWIDWWMSEDMKVRGRPEMDTRGHPPGLGLDPRRDSFVVAEMHRVVDTYGNHPSFIMFCIGNELGNSDFDQMGEWISDLKTKDPRRLYSVSTARKITDFDDYMVTHYIPELGRTRGLNNAGTNWDFEEVYSKMDIPIIAHEIGQWPVYPSWKEISKYSGVLRARNFEEFRQMAYRNGIEDQAESFQKASGALNQIMYKYEIESFLRTASCAGVQLLSMQDYQGQGEALIGWLDAHWDSKGIAKPEIFKWHWSETVPLLRMDKFVWTNNEDFKGRIQLAHHGKEPIQDGQVVCTMKLKDGKILFEKKWDIGNVEIGGLLDVGNIVLPLNEIQYAQEVLISVHLKNSMTYNEWRIWVYPNQIDFQQTETMIVHELDERLLDRLKEGGKVLLIANNLGDEKYSIPIHFNPLYWSLTFFPGQGKTSLGILVNDHHAALRHFPTNFHSDWQWESIFKNTRAFVLNDLPSTYKPIVQVVDDFHRNNKEGVLFEFTYGKGKLLVTGFDINNSHSPVATQLKYSLLSYMESSAFSPQYEINPESLSKLFPKLSVATSVSSIDHQGDVLLSVAAAADSEDNAVHRPWIAEEDRVLTKAAHVSYEIKADGVLKNQNSSSWYGKHLEVTLETPKGFLGSLYILFEDRDSQGREGILEFEGRKVKLGKHHESDHKWIEFHVMREDSNDGRLLLKATSIKGENLMISQLLLIQK